jgi:hypothetical protein
VSNFRRYVCPCVTLQYRRFWDPQAKTLYQKIMSKRSLLVEREVALSNFSDTLIPKVFTDRLWEPLVAKPISPPIELILEFYSNMHDICEDFAFSVEIRNLVFRVTQFIFLLFVFLWCQIMSIHTLTMMLFQRIQVLWRTSIRCAMTFIWFFISNSLPLPSGP